MVLRTSETVHSTEVETRTVVWVLVLPLGAIDDRAIAQPCLRNAGAIVAGELGLTTVEQGAVVLVDAPSTIVVDAIAVPGEWNACVIEALKLGLPITGNICTTPRLVLAFWTILGAVTAPLMWHTGTVVALELQLRALRVEQISVYGLRTTSLVIAANAVPGAVAALLRRHARTFITTGLACLAKGNPAVDLVFPGHAIRDAVAALLTRDALGVVARELRGLARAHTTAVFVFPANTILDAIADLPTPKALAVLTLELAVGTPRKAAALIGARCALGDAVT